MSVLMSFFKFIFEIYLYVVNKLYSRAFASILIFMISQTPFLNADDFSDVLESAESEASATLQFLQTITEITLTDDPKVQNLREVMKQTSPTRYLSSSGVK